jgi:hypothetical protein
MPGAVSAGGGCAGEAAGGGVMRIVRVVCPVVVRARRTMNPYE